MKTLPRILVVDDNRAIHEDFTKILAPQPSEEALAAMENELFGTGEPDAARRGYTIDSAFQGEEGLELVKRSVERDSRYPVAFVDMRMPPGWDGITTIEKIWEADPEIQVVVCTAYSDYSWEEIHRRLGAGDRLLILRKPFDTIEVCQLACALTEKWHLARRAHLKLEQLRAMVHERTLELEQLNRQLLEEIEQRKQSEARYALAALGANDGLWDWHLTTEYIYYSPRWKGMLGYSDDEIAPRFDEWMSRVHPDDIAALRRGIDQHLRDEVAQIHCEFRMRHKDDQYRWILCRGVAARDDARRAVRAAGSFSDITDRRHAEEQLRFDALHDALTGLANRALLVNRLEHLIAQSKRDPRRCFGLLYVDLDHFKIINDSLGHAIGDKLLIEIARRLTKCARQVDTIARPSEDRVIRLGGDEFVLLLEDLHDPADAFRVAERVHSTLAVPFNIDGSDLVTSVSIGITTSSDRYHNAHDMLRDADTALYQAKDAGKGCTRIFDPVMRERTLARWSTENDLRRALERDELTLHFQPVMTTSGQLTSLEALVRWNHPTRGLTGPARFISVAEECGLIIPIGRWVMAAACKQLRTWQLRYPALSALSVAVNVSARQFALPGIVDDISAALDASRLHPQSLRIEITESAAMQNVELAIPTLDRLKRLGVLIYMDDFGTGFSSLSHLHRMPIDAMKIDRSFITAMDTDPMSRSIVQAITTIAHSMKLTVIAEGVERESELDVLRGMGCDYVQGFFYGAPMPPADLEEFFRRAGYGGQTVPSAVSEASK